MKSETEIREKLNYYEAILAGMESGRMLDKPEILRRLSRYLPREVMEMMNNSSLTEVLVGTLPPEDQPWVRQWVNSLAGFAQEAVISRISILRWALEAKTESGGGDRGPGDLATNSES